MKKVKNVVSKILIMLIFTTLFSSVTFSASAHSLTPWSKAYNYKNAGGNHQFAIDDYTHISGRTFNYYWQDNNVKKDFETALKSGAAMWEGMINIKETSSTEAHAKITYDPRFPNEKEKKAAYVRSSDSSKTHYSKGEITAMLVIGNVTSYSLKEKSRILGHELGHLWGILDLYTNADDPKGKTNLESIYSQTNYYDTATRHDKNALFIGLNQPWFIDANGKIKYQKSVSDSGTVSWAKNETYNNYTFDSNGYLTNGPKITYNANGGGNPPATQYKVPGFDIKLSNDTMWAKEKTYTITVDPNGGTLDIRDTQLVPCTFMGWNTNVEGHGTSFQPGQWYKYSNSSTLYAQWKNPTIDECTILNDALGKENTEDKIDPNKTNLKRPGYTFFNWNTDPNGRGQYVQEIDYIITQDTTIYALWLANTYTINYDTNGGYVYTKTDTVKGDASTTLPLATKAHVLSYDANGGVLSDGGKSVSCTFNGWYTASTGGTKRGDVGESYKPCDYSSIQQTLYAQWTNPAAGALATPTREGYAFTGWYTTSTGGTQVTENTTITEDMTLYAHWGPAEGIYCLKNSNSGQYLGVSALDNGAACLQKPLDYANNLKWKITHLGNGEYELRPMRGLTEALGLGTVGNENGATVGIWDTSSYPNYRWKILLNEDGLWTLMSQASEYTKALTIAGGSTSSGALCIQQTVTGALSEKWETEPVDVLQLDEWVSGAIEAGEEAWYSFNPLESGEYTFITRNATTNLNGYLVRGGRSVPCDKSNIGNNARITLQLSAGTTYYMKIQGADSSKRGAFDVGVFRGAAISCIDDFDMIRDNPEGTYFLVADIDFAGSNINWPPITSLSYNGMLNGDGYKIKNIVLNHPSMENVGFFATSDGTIINLTFENVTVIGKKNTGVLAGTTGTNGIILNCHVTGTSTVSGGEYTGGLVGFNKADIRDSSTACNVTATGNFTGGLVGDNYNGVFGCHTTGAINATNYTGGLVGNNRMEGRVGDCYSTGNVTGINRTGGLVGNSESGVWKSYATGNVTGGFNVGGLVGYNTQGNVGSSYSTGSVNVSYDYGGGLVGYMKYGKILQCYSLSNVSGAKTKYMGGFVGYVMSEDASIVNSFACATVKPSVNSAGFAGYMDGSIQNCYAVSDNETGFIKGGNATVTNCYFSNVYGGVDAKAVPKSSAEMMTRATYTEWDFSGVWEINEKSSYPTLQGITKPTILQNLGGTFTVDGVVYKITSPMTVQVGNGNSAMTISGEVDIPAVVSDGTKSYTVTSVGIYAFSGRSITSVTLPATIVSIERNAFQTCYSLTNVTFAAESKLQSIGNHAFNGCTSLTTITIPATVTSLGNNAFQSCKNLTNITFATGSQLQSIGNHAFNGSDNLTEVSIPDSVTTIGHNAFTGCTALVKVQFGTGSQLNNLSSYAFYNCVNLEQINIPDSVRTIGSYAFTFCKKLTCISIPSGVVELPAKVFYGCSSLTEVHIPESVASIATDTFVGCTAVKLYVVEGSYAHDYAVAHHIDYEL